MNVKKFKTKIRNNLKNIDSKEDNIEKFFKKTNKIHGFIYYEDAKFFDFFLNTLNAEKIEGNILEIGAHFGKTSILLGEYVISPNELHVCDVFESKELITDSDNLDEYEESYKNRKPTRKLFEKNFNIFHNWLPVIHQFDSKNLENVLIDHSFKFIHVDGGHTYQSINKDMEIIMNKICKNGVIVMDDYRNYGCFGISTVFWSLLLNQKLNLILITEAKAYFSFGDEKFYISRLEELLVDQKIPYTKESINQKAFIRNNSRLYRKKNLFLRILPSSLYYFLSIIKYKIIKRFYN
jgi:hypothetical protein